MLKILQVCNVGLIVGGTAACAWGVTRALPDFTHEILCLGKLSLEIERVFSPIKIRAIQRPLEEEIGSSQCDLLLLHNTSKRQLPRILSIPTLNYLHSHIDPAPAHHQVVCSEWLNHRYGGGKSVLWQGVPRAPRSISKGKLTTAGQRELRQQLVVGRLCTPTTKKWWPGITAFYRMLSERQPGIQWEFVGCPTPLKSELKDACQGQVTFHEAGWEARSLFWDWDVLLYHHPHLPESFGRTVSEACRAGCIPVVDRKGGFLEQLESGPGYLCETEAEFLVALNEIQDTGQRWKMSRACRVWGDRHFSFRQFRARLSAEFRNLVEKFSDSREGRSPAGSV